MRLCLNSIIHEVLFIGELLLSLRVLLLSSSRAGAFLQAIRCFPEREIIIYESQQIKRRIESYKYQMSHRPTARIIRTTAEKFQQSQGLTNWADRENMKAASKAINEMTADNTTLEELETAALTAFSERMPLSIKN